MGKKKMASRTPPKKGPKKTVEEVPLRSKATGRRRFMVEESAGEDEEMEEAVVTKKRGPKVVLGKRKDVVIQAEVDESEIEDSESEGGQPPTVAEKKGKGKRQKPLANDGKSKQPKAPECVKTVSEVGECSNRVKSQMIVRLKKPVQERMEEVIADENRPVEKEKEVEGHGNPKALYELIQVLTLAKKRRRRGYRVWWAFGVEGKCVLSFHSGRVDGSVTITIHKCLCSVRRPTLSSPSMMCMMCSCYHVQRGMCR
ncbi:uncharacterized protein LOC141630834 [Silene latifolia]|uniref:uncharacterized protein LOC141630834 n=1 Tax=Silene latifolia TaxID=37657 RepID=UPI003D7742F3